MTAPEQNPLLLGLLEDPQDELFRWHFPSKIGGKPAWLIPAHLPSPASLCCRYCKRELTSALQVYAARDEPDFAFHRTLFVFFCQNCGKDIRVFRAQLPQCNKFYKNRILAAGDDECGTDKDWLLEKFCCRLCGLPSAGREEVNEKTSSGKKVEEIEIESDNEPDVKKVDSSTTLVPALHFRCRNSEQYGMISASFEEFELTVQVAPKKQNLFEQMVKDWASGSNNNNTATDLSNKALLEKYPIIDGDFGSSAEKVKPISPSPVTPQGKKSPNKKKVVIFNPPKSAAATTVSADPETSGEDSDDGLMDSDDEEDMNPLGMKKSVDPIFDAYVAEIGANPRQVLRYQYGANPLWFCSEGRLGDQSQSSPANKSLQSSSQKDSCSAVPPCENCGAPRVYEFQILGTILEYLNMSSGRFSSDLVFGTVAIYTCSKNCLRPSQLQTHQSDTSVDFESVSAVAEQPAEDIYSAEVSESWYIEEYVYRQNEPTLWTFGQ